MATLCLESNFDEGDAARIVDEVFRNQGTHPLTKFKRPGEAEPQVRIISDDDQVLDRLRLAFEKRSFICEIRA
jgi:hypothetical protein